MPSRKRGKMDRRRRKRKKMARTQDANIDALGVPTVLAHPIYGEIPLVPESFNLPRELLDNIDFPKDKDAVWYRPDPGFEPDLPTGAVRGNVSRQEFCTWCDTPRYFYVDFNKICVQCGEDFVFEAREQKYWYETLKFHFDSTAIRCKKCRKQRRSDRAVQKLQSVAAETAREKPHDPFALVNLAKTTFEYYTRFGEGKLERAIASARMAIRLDPARYEALYWEALCQEANGRLTKSKDLLRKFLEETHGMKRYQSMVEEAQKRLIKPDAG